MGLSFSTKRQIIIPMVGLGHAGKTTILYRLKLGEFVDLNPTIGFCNTEDIVQKNICFRMFDICDKPHMQWDSHFEASLPIEAFIYVIDSTDKMRLREAKDLLRYLFQQNRLHDAVLLVYANKQDLPNALTPSEIADALELYKVNNRVWYIQVASALQGEGLDQGLNWLSNVLTVPKHVFKIEEIQRH